MTRSSTTHESLRQPRRARTRDPLRESAKYVHDDADVPADIDVFRFAMARRIHTFVGAPRRCRDPLCRRHKLCAGPDMRCARDFPVHVSPQRSARETAVLRRLLDREKARWGREEDEGASEQGRDARAQAARPSAPSRASGTPERQGRASVSAPARRLRGDERRRP
jgi:hypothetical protein